MTETCDKLPFLGGELDRIELPGDYEKNLLGRTLHRRLQEGEESLPAFEAPDQGDDLPTRDFLSAATMSSFCRSGSAVSMISGRVAQKVFGTVPESFPARLRLGQ